MNDSISSLMGEASEDMGWDEEQSAGILIDFLDDLVLKGRITTNEFYLFLQAEIHKQIAKAMEESEAGDEEIAGMMIVCSQCGATGHPDVIHRGECHNQLSQG
jgi:hypothetical protein